MSLRKSSTRRQLAGRSAQPPTDLAAGRPKKPEGLSDEAGEYWGYWIGVLAGHNVLTAHHGRAVQELCETSALIDRLRAEVEKRGPVLASKTVRGATMLRANPAVGLLLVSQKQLFHMLAAFGLTPRSVGEVEQAKPATTKSAAKLPTTTARPRFNGFAGE